MNKYIASLIDYYALYDLHKIRSQVSHYNKSAMPLLSLEDFYTFYQTPKTPQIEFHNQITNDNYSFGTYKYESEVKSDYLCNNISSGTYYKYILNTSAISVILVHGWRMSSTKRLNDIYLESFKELNYDMYYFTLPYHFERNPEQALYSGEFMISADIDRTLLSIKQAVSDLRALIRYLKEKNQNVILIGVSIGGHLTNLVSTIEYQIDMLISVMYANNLAFSILKSIPGKYIRKDFAQHGVGFDEINKVWQITVPSNFKPVVKKEKILLISGLYDKYVLSEDTDLLWESWGRPQRLIYPCGHAGIVLCKDRIAKDTVRFVKEDNGYGLI